jgi:2-oxoglutarate dehydrogenase E1 component
MTNFFDETSFLYNQNASFISDLYLRYLKNPNDVDESWRLYFDYLKEDPQAIEKELKGASWAEKFPFITDIEKPIQLPTKLSPEKLSPEKLSPEKASKESTTLAPKDAQNLIRLLTLIRSYRVRGHLNANLDPLGLQERGHHPDLAPETYGFTEQDLDKPLYPWGHFRICYLLTQRNTP